MSNGGSPHGPAKGKTESGEKKGKPASIKAPVKGKPKAGKG